jgi:hypothetical protein
VGTGVINYAVIKKLLKGFLYLGDDQNYRKPFFVSACKYKCAYYTVIPVLL